MKIFKLTWWMAPFIGSYWLRAQTASHRKDYKKALGLLDTISKLGSNNGRPMGGLYPLYALLRGHVLDGLEEKEDAISWFQRGILDIDKSLSFKTDEKLYLKAYAANEHLHLVPPLKEVDEEGLDEIELGQVRMDFKMCLPLFSHPRWPNPDDIGKEPEDGETGEQEKIEG